jgi:hypothetical protein
MLRAWGWAGAALLLATQAMADEEAGPFEQGSQRLSIILGTVNQNDDTAWVVGAGYGYYLVDGLELGAEAEHWFNSDPTVSKVSPQLRYVLWMVPVLKPYVGTFYRHWFVSDFDDVDSIGGRFGLFWVSGGGSFLGLGAVVEKSISGCEKDCTQFYPEVALSVAL